MYRHIGLFVAVLFSNMCCTCGIGKCLKYRRSCNLICVSRLPEIPNLPTIPHWLRNTIGLRFPPFHQPPTGVIPLPPVLTPLPHPPLPPPFPLNERHTSTVNVHTFATESVQVSATVRPQTSDTGSVQTSAGAHVSTTADVHVGTQTSATGGAQSSATAGSPTSATMDAQNPSTDVVKTTSSIASAKMSSTPRVHVSNTVTAQPRVTGNEQQPTVDKESIQETVTEMTHTGTSKITQERRPPTTTARTQHIPDRNIIPAFNLKNISGEEAMNIFPGIFKKRVTRDGGRGTIHDFDLHCPTYKSLVRAPTNMTNVLSRLKTIVHFEIDHIFQYISKGVCGKPLHGCTGGGCVQERSITYLMVWNEPGNPNIPWVFDAFSLESYCSCKNIGITHGRAKKTNGTGQTSDRSQITMELPHETSERAQMARDRPHKIMKGAQMARNRTQKSNQRTRKTPNSAKP